MLPDELKHEKFVEIGIEQGARNGIHFPIVIVRAPGEIDNHNELTLLELCADWEHFAPLFTWRDVETARSRRSQSVRSMAAAMASRTASGKAGMAPDCEAVQPPQRLPASLSVGKSAPRSR